MWSHGDCGQASGCPPSTAYTGSQDLPPLSTRPLSLLAYKGSVVAILEEGLAAAVVVVQQPIGHDGTLGTALAFQLWAGGTDGARAAWREGTRAHQDVIVHLALLAAPLVAALCVDVHVLWLEQRAGEGGGGGGK